jgi:hypothetical protein
MGDVGILPRPFNSLFTVIRSLDAVQFKVLTNKQNKSHSLWNVWEQKTFGAEAVRVSGHLRILRDTEWRDTCRSPRVVTALKRVIYTAWQWWRKHETDTQFCFRNLSESIYLKYTEANDVIFHEVRVHDGRWKYLVHDRFQCLAYVLTLGSELFSNISDCFRK